MSCGTVVAEVKYLKKLPLYEKEKPFQLFIPVEKDAPDPRSTNLEFEPREQTFVDVRDQLESFSLDSHGFEYRQAPSVVTPSSLTDRELVESQYFDEVKDILKSVSGGYDRVFIYDWRLRDAGREREGVIFDMNDLTTWLRPSPQVHVDQSPRAVLHRIQLHLGDEAKFLLQGRVRVINAWRPVENPVQDYPLAVCDGSTVSEDDLVECDHVRKKFKGANFYSHFNEDQKWYYLGQQKTDEVLLIKMFDSDSSVKATTCPHVSFRHPSCPPDATPRKSIEVRALVFNYPGKSDS